MSSPAETVAAPVPPPRPEGRRHLGRLEPAAMSAVISRELVMFGRFWKSTTFSAVVQPTIYLLAFGLGVGTLVSHVGHVRYVEYVGTGTVATAVLFSSAFPGMFNTFVRWQFQRTYDAMLATPLDTEELITAEILWISVKAGVYGMAPVLVAICFGLDPSWGMLLVPFIGFVTGFGFASFGVATAAVVKTIDNFTYVQSAVLTPLFLVAGTFFPISTLPHGVRIAAEANPLYHCVQLVRDSTIGSLGTIDLWHIGFLLVFAVAMWRLAVRQLGKRLID